MLRKTSSEQTKTIGNEINPYENDGSESGCDLSEHDSQDSKSDYISDTGSEAMEDWLPT